MIFWGSPGTGKTTLAQIIARQSNRPFYEISAINSGVAAIREVIEKAKLSGGLFTAKNPILFIDEIHRFSKSQQDSLLAAVEKGWVTLIGATTENPSFEVNGALLSRAAVYVLKSLTTDDLLQLVDRAIAIDNEFSGNMIDVCPVGALTDKTFRFKNRVWFTKPVDAHRNCTTPGCCGKATLWLRGEEVFRVTARKDEWGEVQSYDGKPGWICNTCRFETKKTASWTIEGITTISRHSVIGLNKYQTLEIPKESAAIDILPPSRTFIACLNPSPTAPSRCASEMLQLSNIISAVSDARMPSLFSFLPAKNPGVPLSTIKAVIPLLSSSFPVRVKTTATSPEIPWVIQFLVPFNIQ
jgi:SpoVK/Ycf46/Vps4 family AAA+-type ATPase